MMVDTMGRKTRTLPKAALVALVSVVLLGTVTPIHAQDLDPASAAALAETLKALANPCVSLQVESANMRPVVTMRTQVQGCVRKSATDRVNIAQYLGAEGDFENRRRRVKKR